MRDLVIGVTVVLPDGLRASSGGKVVKNVAGYDLGKLFCGSRGRLGSVERVALRLHPLPGRRAHGRPRGRSLARAARLPARAERWWMWADGRHLRPLRRSCAVGRRAGGRARRCRRGSRGTSCRALQARLPGRVRWDGGDARSVRPGPRVAYVAEAAEMPWSGWPERVLEALLQPELIADLRPLRLLPARFVSDVHAVARGDGLAAWGRIHLMGGLVDGSISASRNTVASTSIAVSGCMACAGLACHRASSTTA